MTGLLHRVPRVVLVVLLASMSACDWLAPAPPEPVVYTVVRGDTLTKIAKAHGVTVAQLRTENGIQGDLIEIDQVLRIPVSTTTQTGGVSVATPRASRVGRRSAGPAGSGPSGASPQSRRQPPAPKPCLAGPTLAEAGDGTEPAFAASRGLTEAEISAAMNAFLPTLSACLPTEEPVTGVLVLDMTVACTGVVAEVAVADDGDLPAGLVSCVTTDLQAAAFPAHDLPDGMTFRYPMRFY